jgi:pyridoxine 4-dehydrogenase
MTSAAPGGTFTAGDLTLSRMGFGAMQLAGPGVFGPPADRAEAVAVLRTAVELGITHIDTSDFYGPFVTNEIIREALAPYPDDLTIVTKVGAKRGDGGSWLPALEPDELKSQVHDNLRHLGLETLDVVNLRVPTSHPDGHSAVEQPIGHMFSVLAELQKEGLIRHLGVSVVTPAQLSEAQEIAPVVTVQNMYNVVHRGDDELVARCAAEDIAYAPFFPLGGFTPLQSDVLNSVADRLGASLHQVALAWLLQRSPAIVLIPGTSSVAHLRDNVAAADLELPADAVAELDSIGGH